VAQAQNTIPQIAAGAVNQGNAQGYGAGKYGVGLYGTALVSSSGETYRAFGSATGSATISL